MRSRVPLNWGWLSQSLGHTRIGGLIDQALGQNAAAKKAHEGGIVEIHAAISDPATEIASHIL